MPNLEGMDKVIANIAKTEKGINKIIDKTIGQVADKVLEESRDLAPKKKGTLRGKSDTRKVKEHTYEIFYDTVYAARLHEHPEYRFTTPGTGGKYLEKPFLKYSDMLSGLVKKSISSYL